MTGPFQTRIVSSGMVLEHSGLLRSLLKKGKSCGVYSEFIICKYRNPRKFNDENVQTKDEVNFVGRNCRC